MSKIDVSQWKEFKLSKLFDVDLSDGDNKPKQLESGDIPLVVASGDNNGIIGKFTSDTRVYPEGTITLDMFGHAFLQNHKFQAVSHGRVNMLLPKMDVSLNSLLFIVGVLNKKCSEGAYGYSRMLSQSKANAIVIKLPVTSFGQPDWHYMDEYIAKRAALAHKYVSELAKAKDKPEPLKFNGWKEFKLTDLFNVKTGAYLSKHQLKPGSIPRVTVSSVNNGIVGSFEKCGLPNERLFSNFLSVNFFGNVFYHDSLCSVDMKVHVLEPKYLYSKESMLFLVVVLRRKFVIEGYGTYGNQLSSSKLKMDKVYLPVDASGNPDWHYMDNYVASMKSIASQSLNKFHQIFS